MMYQWKPDMVRFMRDASEHSDYNQALADQMRPWLSRSAHVCDAGCGLGYLSLALSPYVERVTAVDVNPNALRVLTENCCGRGVSNTVVRRGDIALLPPERPYDAMAFCFFGGMEQILSVAKEQCAGSVFVMARNYASHRFSVGDHKKKDHSFSSARDILRRKGIPFQEQELELELGQPFRSRDDARRFFQLYSRDADQSVITDEFLADRLVGWERDEFRLYMPHRRKVGWLRFDARDIPEQ